MTFAKAVIEVFETQVGAPNTVPGEMTHYHPDTFNYKLDVASSVGLICPRFSGCLTLGFPEETFLKSANSVLGESYTAITDENRDFGAEMMNIILGVTKTNYSAEQGIVIQPAIPLVVQGAGIKFSLPPEFIPFLIPFNSDMGPFYTTVAVSQIT